MTSTEAAHRFQELPRAVRWLAVAGTFIVLFLVWDATIGSVVRHWNDEADAIDRQVVMVRASSETAERLERMDDTVVGLGAVVRPRREDAGRAGLTSAVVAVVQERIGDKNYSFDLSGGGDRLPQDLSTGIVRPGYRITRLTGTLKFQASPDDAIAIIAALENREEIEAIRKVSIIKGDSRGRPLVDANLILETWVETPSAKKRR